MIFLLLLSKQHWLVRCQGWVWHWVLLKKYNKGEWYFCLSINKSCVMGMWQFWRKWHAIVKWLGNLKSNDKWKGICNSPLSMIGKQQFNPTWKQFCLTWQSRSTPTSITFCLQLWNLHSVRAVKVDWTLVSWLSNLDSSLFELTLSW